MKLDTISKMEAGSELNTLIAEEVMGWKIHNRHAAYYVDAGKENDLIENVRADFDWSPSKNIWSAWEVVNRLPSIGMFLECKQWPDCWQITIVKNKGTHRDYMVGNMHFKDFCEGVAKAALIAILRERGELEE